MRKKSLLIFLIALLFVGLVVLYTHTSRNRTIYHVNELSDNTVQIVKIENFSGDILKIPDKCDNKKVTSISQSALLYSDDIFSNVKSLILPNGVRELANETFSKLTSLEEVTIGSDFEFFNARAFSGTKLSVVHINKANKKFKILDGCLISTENDYITLYYGSHIPNTVNIIGKYAFAEKTLDSISIPESVMYIEDGAFYGCSKIESIIIHENVQKVGDYAFAYCKDLKNVVFKYGVKQIGEKAFMGCKSLISISISDSVNEIGRYALAGTGLIDIPHMGGITHIPSYLFKSCENFTSIHIPEGIESIDNVAFSNCDNLKSVNLPASLLVLNGWDTFWYCFNLDEITIAEDNLKYYTENNCLIERETMTLILGTNSSIIPYGVKCIGEASLAMCDGLTSVSIPATVVEIQKHAFSDSKKLQYLYIPESVKTVENHIVVGNAENMHIYCGAKSQPDEWKKNWNAGDYPVIWESQDNINNLGN